MSGSRALKICDTILRDAHQSQMATRMRTKDMLPVADKLDQVGYHSLEMWGGASFDSCLRFLGEDPWYRLRKLRELIPNTSFMMLLRGQNILGYRHYPDDVVEEFCRLSVKNGIDIMRIFDALNDIRNMEVAIRATKEAGGHVQGTVVYTISPVHDTAHYVETALALQSLGADSICLKDMAGLMAPYYAYELISTLKKEISIPIQLHCHYTSGMAGMTYIKAAEAGVDVVDTALSALALGTSQPATETVVAALQGTPYDTGLDLELLSSINDHFQEIKKEYAEYLSPVRVDNAILTYQVPGGMLSNLESQLREQGMYDRVPQVLSEVPQVRADLGYPPLVTPMSQIVGHQSFVNVVTGKRYSLLSKEIKDYVRGLYGRPPGEISPEIRQQIIGSEEPIDVRPAELQKPRLESARDEIKDYITQEEDVLTYILFPEIAMKFFEKRKADRLND